ncbi:hypothetical protein [Jiangella muralis]|uniref:hypothetical protein n=1 Tax=Jiangella muralis TaxID=702383 RepID=UPI00069D60E5|nr:hypothetical protein [Jiangella muralis]
MLMPSDYRPEVRDAILTAVALNLARGESLLELVADLGILRINATRDQASDLRDLAEDLAAIEDGSAGVERFLGDRPLYGPPAAFLDAKRAECDRQLGALLARLITGTPAPVPA